ncbi:MAG: PepSY domain-containing protein [bacterium]
MWRNLHSILGLISLVLVVALSLSGAVLAFYPVQDGLSSQVQATTGITVADLAGRVAAQVPDIQALHRRPSGKIEVDYTDATGAPQKANVDATTGKILAPETGRGDFYDALKTFHRSLFLGENGRIVAGTGAVLMAMVSVFGLLLLVSRMGGVRRVFDRPKGQTAGRLHTIMTRLTVLPLLLSAITGSYIALTEFNVITVTTAQSQSYPASADYSGPPVSPGTLKGLAAVPLADLRDLQFPYPDDPTDIFTVKTDTGLTLVDQFNGDVLETVPATTSERVYAWFYALHTGEGLAYIGALLGLSALFAPLIGFLGVAVWWRRRKAGQASVTANAPANSAEIVILVGSEGGTTWGFARVLHRELTKAGKSVHLAPMSGFRSRYDKAEHLFFLASTYGNGHAPDSAANLLKTLRNVPEIPHWSSTVLGFGDRAFAQYCQFAKDIDTTIQDRGWPRLMLPTFINRQSTQAFASWGVALGTRLGLNLTLTHEVEVPPTRRLILTDKEVYGTEVQTPTVILRFREDPPAPRSLLARLTRAQTYSPTDLLGVLPPSGKIPRFYSVSSAASSSEVEICVRKQTGGECSSYLCDLEPGDAIQAFARPNPEFTLPAGRAPVIMVSAGTGIAPFIGLIRSNTRHRPFHLFWGGRSPESDFLYWEQLDASLAQQDLTTLTTAFSRVRGGAYVQNRVAAEAARLADLIRQGASVMVCGGDAMARAVREEFETILAPLGQSVLGLKQQNRYLEDIF